MKVWIAWLVAVAACLAIYWEAFEVWFLMDDFAWLGLKQEIDAGGGWRVLFEPRAQGTVRLFSERLYFFLLTGIFGLNPVPFRVCAFGGQLLSLWLLVRLAVRFSPASPLLAGIATGIFYACSAAMLRPLAWASAFNQIFASCCILIAFSLLLRWLDTGQRRDWWMHLAVFLFSFGVLESVVVYPAAATLYCLLFARERWRHSLWLWLPSLAFALLHLFVIQRPAGNEYAAVYGLGMLASLLQYTEMAFAAWWLGALAVAGVVWSAVWRGERRALFFLVWFVLFLAPVLPFQNRISGYYLVLPLTGAALALGLAAGSIPIGTITGTVQRVPLLLVCFFVGCFVWMSAANARVEMEWFLENSARIRSLLESGVETARAKNADTLLLSGVDTMLFNTALQDQPFRLYGLTKVYLVPGSESGIHARADLGGVSAYRISLQQAVQALETGRAAVLSISGGRVSDATARYRNVVLPQYLQNRPRSIALGEKGYESLLGPGWWPAEGKFRWMSKSATLRIGAGASAKRLQLSGFVPDTVIARGPVTLTVSAAGSMLGMRTFTKVDAFDFGLDLGRAPGEWLEVRFEVDRVSHAPGDKRDLGLILSTVSVK